MDGLIEALFEVAVAVAEPVISCLSEVISAILFQFAATAFCCVLFTPVVLIRACFGPGFYFEKVMSAYGEIIVTGFWT